MNQIPIEARIEVQEQYDTEVAYMKEKNAKTHKKYLNLNSSLRKVADKLNDMFKQDPYKIINYTDFAEETGIKESVVRNIINQLATWDGYPQVIINSPKKTGCFQLYSKDLMDTKKWIIHNQRYLATKDQRLRKTTTAYEIKRNSIKKERGIRKFLGLKKRTKDEESESS